MCMMNVLLVQAGNEGKMSSQSQDCHLKRCGFFVCVCPCSQKKPQRVSLMFEDETEDDERDSLFGFMPANNNTVPSAKVSMLG